MKKSFLCILPLVVLSLFLNVYGIWWGVPDESRIDLVFGSRSLVEQLGPEMQKSREDVRSSLDQIYAHEAYDERVIKIKTDKGVLSVMRSHLDSARSYLTRSYGGDEQRPLAALAGMNPSRFDLNPRFFSYGGFFIYSMGAFLKTLSLFKVLVLRSGIQYYFMHPQEMGKLFIYARLLGAVFASLAVFVIFLTGRQLYNFKTGLISAILLCLTPGVVFWSHLCKPFAFCLFWTLLSVFFSSRILKSDKISNYVLSAIFAGLAAGGLILHGFIFIAIPIAHFLHSFSEDKNMRSALVSLFQGRLFLSLFITLLAFFAVNPYYVLTFGSAAAEIRGTMAWWAFNPSLVNVFNYIRIILLYQFGLLLWILVLAAVAYLIYCRKKEDLFLLLIFIPFCFYLSSTAPKFTHHGLSLLPFLILSAARLLERGLSNKRTKILTAVILFIVSLYSFMNVIALDRVFGGESTRTEAGKWIGLNLPAGSTIGFLAAPSPWRSPPVNPFKYKLKIVSYNDSDALAVQKPEYFVISEAELLWTTMEYFSSERIEEFLTGYEEIVKFENEPSLFFLKFRWTKVIPHDWHSPNPSIAVFRRK